MSQFAEVAKLSAFVRRDLRIAMSYRVAAFGGLLALAAQVLIFSFVGKLVDPTRLPAFGGTRATYMEFVTVGIALNMIVLMLLQQVATAIRTEQMLGTLESLLSTPTRVGTIQTGSAALAVLTVPLRMCLFTVVLALVFGLDFHTSGILPSVVVLVGFLPFLWGLGLLSGGAILTFRRGVATMSLGMVILGLASGAFFPLYLLPQWLHDVANANPLAIAIQALRETLIGGTGWASIGSNLVKLVPISVAATVAGAVAFRLALARERRNGTLGLY